MVFGVGSTSDEGSPGKKDSTLNRLQVEIASANSLAQRGPKTPPEEDILKQAMMASLRRGTSLASPSQRPPETTGSVGAGGCLWSPHSARGPGAPLVAAAELARKPIASGAGGGGGGGGAGVVGGPGAESSTSAPSLAPRHSPTVLPRPPWMDNAYRLAGVRAAAALSSQQPRAGSDAVAAVHARGPVAATVASSRAVGSSGPPAAGQHASLVPSLPWNVPAASPEPEHQAEITPRVLEPALGAVAFGGRGGCRSSSSSARPSPGVAGGVGASVVGGPRRGAAVGSVAYSEAAWRGAQHPHGFGPGFHGGPGRPSSGAATSRTSQEDEVRELRRLIAAEQARSQELLVQNARLREEVHQEQGHDAAGVAEVQELRCCLAERSEEAARYERWLQEYRADVDAAERRSSAMRSELTEAEHQMERQRAAAELACSDLRREAREHMEAARVSERGAERERAEKVRTLQETRACHALVRELEQERKRWVGERACLESLLAAPAAGRPPNEGPHEVELRRRCEDVAALQELLERRDAEAHILHAENDRGATERTELREALARAQSQLDQAQGELARLNDASRSTLSVPPGDGARVNESGQRHGSLLGRLAVLDTHGGSLGGDAVCAVVSARAGLGGVPVGSTKSGDTGGVGGGGEDDVAAAAATASASAAWLRDDVLAPMLRRCEAERRSFAFAEAEAERWRSEAGALEAEAARREVEAAVLDRQVAAVRAFVEKLTGASGDH
eukprot:TRINITY_DN21375_c0_g1_i2.p1 TRINITY_DN21375_c0_g1~~TRINITY_DN21375_c0_g1_i2.p1  ORF type:complete len:762 (+),score=166.00 TRINITY_DN21375_c0_g1_i2:76-2286(+)